MSNERVNFIYLPSTVENKSVLVTGGTSGIGRAIAVMLASKGANVLIAGRDEDHLNEAMEELQKNAVNNVHGIIADLSDNKGVSKLFAEADSRFQQLDILINNAALAHGGILAGEYPNWEEVIKTNLLGYIACARAAVDRMKKNKTGHIVNIGSMSADVREKHSAVYVATKSGIQGFSESLRKEVNESGIKVTLIEPGAVATAMQELSEDEKDEKIEKQEILKPDDIASAVLFALSQPERCDVVEMKIRPHLQMI